MKKFVLFLVALMVVLSVLSSVGFAESGISIYVNEQPLQCDVAPFIDNGRTLVPMRQIFEALNAQVSWEGDTKTITATKGDIRIVLQINNKTMFKNGTEITMDVAPVISADRTFVPIRAVSQSLGAEVLWCDGNKTVYINSPVSYSNAVSSYSDPKVTMYAPDGRTLDVSQSEVESYINVGWYQKPVSVVYAPDGRSMTVYTDEVPAYLGVGWYATRDQAQNANKPTNNYSNISESSNSTTSNSGNSYNNSNNSGGSAVYRTPKGKKYHFDPECGGKNSYQITMEQAQSAGLTPCSKCA